MAARSTTTSRTERVVVVVDTREQQPYELDAEHVAICRRALPAGDYSLDGHEDQIAAERKSLDDFVTSAVLARERFGRELEILSSYEHSCVVVEATLTPDTQGVPWYEEFSRDVLENAVLCGLSRANLKDVERCAEATVETSGAGLAELDSDDETNA